METGSANEFTADELLAWLIEAEYNDRHWKFCLLTNPGLNNYEKH